MCSGNMKLLLYQFGVSAIVCAIILFLPISRELRFAIVLAFVAAFVAALLFEGIRLLSINFQIFANFLNLKIVKFTSNRIVILAVALAAFFGARALYSPPPRHTILYLSPVRFVSRQPFYAEFVDKLIQESANQNFDVTVWEPDQSWIASSMQHLLKEAAKRKKEYAAIVFTPFIESSTNPGPEDEEFFRFLTDAEGSNVVLFDTDLSESLRQRLAKENLSLPPCVKGNDWEAGRLAAQAMVDYFYRNQIIKPTVAVVDKLQAMDRSIAFRSSLETEARKKHLKPNPTITWYWFPFLTLSLSISI
jgi:hypothetical protein